METLLICLRLCESLVSTKQAARIQLLPSCLKTTDLFMLLACQVIQRLRFEMTSTFLHKVFWIRQCNMSSRGLACGFCQSKAARRWQAISHPTRCVFSLPIHKMDNHANEVSHVLVIIYSRLQPLVLSERSFDKACML